MSDFIVLITLDKDVFNYIEKSKKLHIPLVRFNTNLYYHCPDTAEVVQSAERLFISIGTCVQYQNKDFTFLFSDQRQPLFENSELRNNAGGGWLSFQYAQQKWEMINDPLGLRDGFIKQENGVIIVSSRLDWLVALSEQTRVDEEAMSELWFFGFVFSDKTWVQDVQRLSQNGQAKGNLTDFLVTRNYFQYKQSEDKISDLNTLMKKLLQLPIKAGKKVSLGLTGGMDCRVLLSYLLKEKSPNLHTHYWGEDGHADTTMFERLTKEFNLPAQRFKQIPFEAEQYFKQAGQYNRLNGFVRPSHVIQNWYNLFDPYFADKFVLDGGCGGELMRRNMFMYLYHFKGRDVLKGDFMPIVQRRKLKSGVCFKEKIASDWLASYQSNLLGVLRELPQPKDVGLKNWFDLFYVRIFMSHYYNFDQIYVDQAIKSFMPYVHPKIINTLFSKSLSKRSHAEMPKKLIKMNTPELSNYPLAYGNALYPYYSPYTPTYFWAVYQQKKKKAGDSHPYALVLRANEGKIREEIFTAEVKKNGYFDQAYLEKVLSSFFENKDDSSFKMLSNMLDLENLRSFVQKDNPYADVSLFVRVKGETN